MAINAAHWSVDRATGNIRYIGDDHGGASPSYATVIEFHRWLQGLADDLVSSGDDELDITDENPSARSTDNIITLLGNYNIDANAAEHLYDGSISQNGGADIYGGFVNFGNVSKIQIIQNGAVLTDDWWNANGGLNANPSNGVSHRFMLLVKSGGTDIDNRKVIATSRTFGKTYSEFIVNSAGVGNNVLALSEADDLNNQTVEGTVATWTTITNTNEGYVGADIDQNSVTEYYYGLWNADKPTRSINDFYERAKYLTRDGSAETLYGLSGELFRGVTHEINIDTVVGVFTEPEAISWTGGTGQLFGTDQSSKIWMQLLTGSAPADNDVITGGTSGATCAVNVTVQTRPLSFPFVGASTGSAIIGSYGLGIELNDLTSSDKLFDLTNAQITPPNVQSFFVNGLVASEDTVQVAPWDGVSTDNEGNPAIDKNQFSLSTSLTTDNITSVVVGAAIPADTPSSGYIRVVDNNGFARRLHFSSWTGSTFTIDTIDGQEDFLTVNATAGNNVWISYIDETASSSTLSFQAEYISDRGLVVIVRDGGGTPIKQFISSSSFSSSGGSISVIRTSDL